MARINGIEDSRDVVKSYELCINAHLTRPVDLMDFSEIIQELEHIWLSVVRVPGLDG